MHQRTNSLYSNKIKHNLIYLTQQDLRKDKVTSVLSVIVFFNLTLCKITTLIMKIKKSLILFFLSALVNNADAQIRGVLIDVETRQPIDGVASIQIRIKNSFLIKTDTSLFLIRMLLALLLLIIVMLEEIWK